MFALGAKLVEAAGFAPACSDREREPSTCVVPHRAFDPNPPAERAHQDLASDIHLAAILSGENRSQPAHSPPGPQADQVTALPNYLGSDLECLRSENALRFCYWVVVGTCQMSGFFEAS